LTHFHPKNSSFWAQSCAILSDAIWPPRCAGCLDWNSELFCADCALQLKPIEAPLCFRCGLPFDPLSQAADICAACRDNRYHAAPPIKVLRSVYEFEGPRREAIHRFKYAGKTALANPLALVLAEYLQQAAGRDIDASNLGAIVPVPLHAWRKWRRGYNQSTLIARELSRFLQIPVYEMLQRPRHTAPQVELSAKERARNIHDAFEINLKMLNALDLLGKPILLIDDVCTTGATLQECARVLQQAGIKTVYALTLARQL